MSAVISKWWPTPAEAGSLRFLLSMPSLETRVLTTGALFLVGLGVWSLAPGIGALGLLVAILGHLPLWVRRQTTAPGGATPVHEEVWAPTEDDWTLRVGALEQQGKDWDTSPWDITSGRGILTLLLVIAALGFGIVVMGAALGGDAAMRLAVAAAVLILPLWLNGIRTTWNPSELRLKGEALDVARGAVAGEVEGELDRVPLLALREGRRGKYPVDARLMLRPAEDDGTSFLGVQVQVAINNVQGTDFPYLYCVVLGKEGFRLPAAKSRHRSGAVELVYERGDGDDVSYLVIRQHADKAGGWHTEPEHIRGIMRVALQEARRARQANLAGETP